MSTELHDDVPTAHPSIAGETAPLGRERPNVSGDLPSVLHAAPMFRRVLLGYDRFQVDTYVRWAEDELATADRERDHLVARHVETRTELAEARELLSHSAGGAEFLQLSRRIGTMLAAAADEAESMRAEAKVARAHAAGQATRTVARADQALADAEVEAERLVAAAAARVEEMTVQAARIVDEAEQACRSIHADAEARLEAARLVGQRAGERAEQIHRQAADEAAAARLVARTEILAMLDAGRAERRRADAEGAAIRERLDRESVARRAVLLGEIEALERRRSALRAELELMAGPATAPTEGPLGLPVRRLHDRLRWRHGSLRAS
jgi:hypothetical protein